MGRPSKSVAALEKEGKSHRTKAEIEARKEAEKEITSGKVLIERREVKKNKVAHKEFLRLKKIFEGMDKADELYSACINRYCLLYAECLEFEKIKETYEDIISEIKLDKEKIVEDFVDDVKKDTISLAQYYKLKNNFSKYILQLDSQIMQKRKMMFDIEKENIMTVASGLRSIPKEPVNKENPLLKALSDDSDDDD